VNLALKWHKKHVEPSYPHPSAQVPLEDIHTIPVTAWVNQESRQETLRGDHIIFSRDAFSSDEQHFCEIVMSGDDTFGLTQVSRAIGTPIIFNPDIDSVSISQLQVCRYIEDNDQWLKYLDRTLPGGLASIKELEIRDFYTFNPQHMGQIFMEFPGLKRIYFTLTNYFYISPSVPMWVDMHERIWHYSGVQEWQAILDRFFDGEVGPFERPSNSLWGPALWGPAPEIEEPFDPLSTAKPLLVDGRPPKATIRRASSYSQRILFVP
jgi:hypothetical protein